ncbi:MAG: pilus assembly protein [Bacilli bacterium]
MKSRGQALVEFVIILPVILMLVFLIVDFGRVLNEKNSLENVVSDAVNLYKNGKNESDISNELNKERKDIVLITISVTDEYVTIRVKNTIKPITPGLNLINKNVFNISSSRVIYNE